MPLSPGETLNNRYRIVKLLGQGGFGAVYRAWDTNLDEPVALKESVETSPAALKQFQIEAKILFRLRHPNLPVVHDVFIVPGQGMYLVMDFVEGEDLQQMLQREAGPLKEEQVQKWIGQVCDALQYLHSQDPPIIHRDIKPANIRITPSGKAMLVDFGIAKVYDPSGSTTAGARAVTPGFSPHEQYSLGKTDPRTDVYALGATLYTLLTGQVPPESIQRFVKDPIHPPEQYNPYVSQSSKVVIQRALHVDPDTRFQTISEFKAALLEPFPSGERVSETGPQEPKRASTQATIPAVLSLASRRKLIFAGSIVLAGAIILLVLLFQMDWKAYLPGVPPSPMGQGSLEATIAISPPISSMVATPSESPALAPSPLLPQENIPPPSDTPQAPRIIDFFFCDRKCDEPGAVRKTEFPERITEIYAGFQYQGMSTGLQYTRTWSMDDQEWVRYDCAWQGPENGTYYLKLWDSSGLKSGTWVVSMYIEGQLAYKASFRIEGIYDFWDPAGILPCNDW